MNLDWTDREYTKYFYIYKVVISVCLFAQMSDHNF